MLAYRRVAPNAKEKLKSYSKRQGAASFSTPEAEIGVRRTEASSSNSEWPQEEIDEANSAWEEALHGPPHVEYILEDPRADLPTKRSCEPSGEPNATGEPIYGDRETAARITGRSKWEFTRTGAQKMGLKYLEEKRSEVNRRARAELPPSQRPLNEAVQVDQMEPYTHCVLPNAPIYRRGASSSASAGPDVSNDDARAVANNRRKRIISRAMREADQVPLPDSGDERMYQFYRRVHLECSGKKKAADVAKLQAYRQSFEEEYGHSHYWNGTPGEEYLHAPDGSERTNKAKALAALEAPGVHWPRCEICRKKVRHKHASQCPGCRRTVCLNRCMLQSRRHRIKLCLDCAGNESFDSWSQSSDSTGSDIDVWAARLIPNCYAWRNSQAQQ